MSTTAQYLMFGAAALCFFVAWSFYVRKLGGFIEYFNRPWHSIAIFAVAALVGVATYYVAMVVQDYPTEEMIRKAQSGESPEDAKSYDESVGTIRDDDEAAEAPDARGSTDNKWVGMHPKNLQIALDNARLLARQIGIAAGLFVAAIGYGVMGMRLARKRAEGAALAAEAATLAPPPSAPAFAEADLHFEEEAPVRESGAPPASPARAVDLTADEGPYEPYEPPVSIDELEKGYTEYKKDKEGGR